MEIVLNKPDKNSNANTNLRAFFIEHLNMIYSAKLHLVERLPEIAEQAEFSDLRYAVLETVDDVNNQIIRMNEIYALLEAEYSMDDWEDKIIFLEDAYNSIYKRDGDDGLKDMSILFYMQVTESIEVASFHVLMMVAAQFKNKQIVQLLRENADEAKGDLALFAFITAKYIKK